MFAKGISPAVGAELVGDGDPQSFGSVSCCKQVLLPVFPYQIG